MNKEIKFCIWNVNSLLKRFNLVKDIILKNKPNFFLIQETRNNLNPELVLELQSLGYRMYHCKPIKGRNGVAIICSREFKLKRMRSLPFIEWEYQGRFQHLSFTLNNRLMHIINVYIPTGMDYCNGKTINDLRSKYFKGNIYRRKILFLKRLYTLVSDLNKDYIVLGGDFNIVAMSKDSWHRYRDVECKYLVNFSSLEKEMMGRFLGSLIDHGYGIGEEHNYTWYDYKFPLSLNRGMKLDYLFTSSNLNFTHYERLVEYRQMRPTSDHVPLLYSFVIE